jgi:hypothetical protein
MTNNMTILFFYSNIFTINNVFLFNCLKKKMGLMSLLISKVWKIMELYKTFC